jgi:type I restriction enzyme M protein
MLEDLKRTLWATANKLRANLDAAGCKRLVLSLIGLPYISDNFQAKRTELTARFADSADKYFLDISGQLGMPGIDTEHIEAMT